MGGPHCTFLVSDFPAINIEEMGQELVENNQLFPKASTTVQFARVENRQQSQGKRYGRGVQDSRLRQDLQHVLQKLLECDEAF